MAVSQAGHLRIGLDRQPAGDQFRGPSRKKEGRKDDPILSFEKSGDDKKVTANSLLLLKKLIG
jgi:hypothetical protein